MQRHPIRLCSILKRMLAESVVLFRSVSGENFEKLRALHLPKVPSFSDIVHKHKEHSAPPKQWHPKHRSTPVFETGEEDSDDNSASLQEAIPEEADPHPESDLEKALSRRTQSLLEQNNNNNCRKLSAAKKNRPHSSKSFHQHSHHTSKASLGSFVMTN